MATANNNTGFATSIALNPTNIGDIFVLVIELKYSAASNRTVTGISGTGITWQGAATFQRFMTDGIHSVEIWYGTVTATGSHTHTVSYSSTTGQAAGSINGHQLTSTAGSTTVWSVDGAAGTRFNDPNTNNTTFTYPTQTSALDKECYVGYLAIASSASAGSGSGWVYTQDLRGNWDAVNVNIGNAGTAASTTQTSGSSQLWFTVGVLFQAASAGTVHPLAADGLASSSGSASFTLTEPLVAAGMASSSGTATFILTEPLVADGEASSSGSATFNVKITLAADGKASSSGSIAFTVLLAADGKASSSGTASLTLKVSLTAAGKASSSGTALLITGKVQDPFAVVAPRPKSALLGCGTWRVFVATRGGGSLLAELDFENLTLTRKLSDASDCSVVVSGDVSAECAPVLAEIEPFQHEIVAFRNWAPGDTPAWAGPVTVPVWGPLDLTIGARDLFSWFDRRQLPFGRNFLATDLGSIFGQYMADAMVQDPSPNVHLQFRGEIGVVGARSVSATGAVIAGDALRELSRSGVDFTAIGRSVYWGGMPDNTLTATLYDGAILQDAGGSSPKLTKQGLNMATQVIVNGATLGFGVQVQSTVGFPDAEHGLITLVVSEPLIMDAFSATEAGAGRLAFLNPAPHYLTCVLSPQAPVTFEQLIPGIRLDTAFRLGVIDVVGSYRLQGVSVSVANTGDEAVALTLVPLVT